MIAAVEKQKFVYVLNRDAAANLTISSPLEAHKSHNVVFSVAALDCGFDNPVFATIELDYSDADQARAAAACPPCPSALGAACRLRCLRCTVRDALA
jgi:splicing factor 3B subunit 3